MKYELAYLNHNLIFEEMVSEDLSDVVPLIESSLGHALKAQSSSGADAGDGGPKAPCTVLNCNFPDGIATLNVYLDEQDFVSVWALDARRWKNIPFLTNDYVTDFKPTNIGTIRSELTLLAGTAAETINRFKSANEKQ